MIRRGDVVIVDIPCTDIPGGKTRPVAVVQNDKYHQTIRKTVVAIFTGNQRRKGGSSHLFVDPSDADGASSGLTGPALACWYNLFTAEQDRIAQVIGSFSDALRQKLNSCAESALGLS
jgi:mRNA-degrading endonuclease toxin of MazEF toxin-antitoxin module